jgi:hypothetical protein
MNDFQSLIIAEQRRREFIQEVTRDRLAQFVTGDHKKQKPTEFTAASTHSTGKTERIRQLIPVTVGSLK